VIISVDFDVTDQLHEGECNGTVRQLFIDFEKVYDSVRREVLYNIVTEFGIPAKI
jgi:hypothetical protein